MKTIDVQYPEILNICITHLQNGTLSFEACLAQYPLYADQLQQDLSVFQFTEQISAPELNPQAVDTLEANLLAKFNGNTTAPQPQIRPPRPQPTRVQRMTMPYMRWAAGFAIFFMVMFGAGGGAVMASSNSLPGDTLYGVKIAWEQVVLFVASLISELDDIWLQLTRTRANEVITLYDAGRLTEGDLESFYVTAENAILFSTPDTQGAYLDLMDEIRPAFSEAILLSFSEVQRIRVLQVLSPQIDAEGRLVLPPADSFFPPAEAITPTLTPTIEPTVTLTSTTTPTPSITPTFTATIQPTVTRTPTPSRTPTEVPSLTPTLTLTAQPTATWTPLGIQPRGEEATLESDIGETVNSGTQATKPFFTGENEFFVRETERAVEMTQTAIAETSGG